MAQPPQDATSQPPTLEYLIRALDDDDEDIRSAVAKALGEIGGPAVESLIMALEDEDEDVRFQAAEALGKIGDPVTVEPLLGALEDEDGDVRCAAAGALGEIGDPVAVEPLMAALEDEYEDVRYWAASSLGDIGDPVAVEPLIRAREDDDLDVRRAAISALEKIQETTAPPVAVPPQQVAPIPDALDTRECPCCAETIKANAVVCRYCGADLASDGLHTKRAVSAPSGVVGGIALIVPLCAALIIWFWIGNMTILESPSSKLAIVAVLTVIITAIMIAVDASLLRMGAPDDVTEKGRKREGPVTWCVFVLLFWIVGFPAYYFRRKRYGQRNYVVVALVIALIFLGMVVGFAWAIEEKKSDIRQMLNMPESRIFIHQTIALENPSHEEPDSDKPSCRTRAELLRGRGDGYDRGVRGLSF